MSSLMTKLSRCVLIVEDEYLIALALAARVEDMGLVVCASVETAAEAIAAAQAHRPAVVLMDMRLKGKGDGVDAAMVIHQTVGSKVIFVTGSREQATIERINLDHPFATLFKPVSDRQLQGTITEALRAVPGLV
jgi:CheY-like chemotaxis protein